ncbi:uncharacterized protein B0I36DRAFT_326453 [Microdochium trichocladiopsis]|uniref:Zn(2)-C6 fungal-type domain-containing protein n=1 Tax=Microdochium trichocladiopsis TaxID=1682393 RepID=A0A9P8Y560_9PEZI|nr:uncharacterized protein B0I36DRAFT_326453 [Microdochium trichocladiopsis]KAH7029881.1 hypothetical protein B0I36DRAFT_326453 [Microdochium trichocladiopsis]
MERSRTGCATCRKRKRKCDETRPACRACTSRGVECGGYSLELRWGNAVASRGHLAGATTPVRPPTSKPAAARRQHQQQDQAAQSMSLSVSLSQSPAAAVQCGLSPPEEEGGIGSFIGATVPVAHQVSSLPLPPSATGPNQVGPAFEKFLRIGLRRLYASKVDAWIETMFRDLSADSLALKTAGAALQTMEDEGRSPRALQAIGDTIRTLREELHQSRGALCAATMCACLLLCSLQLVQGEPWTGNLKLMTDLYNLGGSLDAIRPDPETDFALRHQLEVLAMMDISFLVVGRTTPSVGLWPRFRRLQDTWTGGRLKGNETVSGLPRSLLDILARSSVQQDAQVEQDLWLWTGDPGELVSCQHWDAVKYAGLLRLRRCRRYSSPISNMVEPETPSSVALPPSELILLRLLSCLEALLNGLERPEYHDLLISHSILFPMTEASLMVSALQQHRDWIRPLSRMRNHGTEPHGEHPRHVSLLYELLDEAWNAGQDFHDIDKAAQRRGVEIAVF